MKKLIFLLLLIPQIFFAQKEYAPLNAIWRCELHSFGCTDRFLEYRVDSEIEIDGKDCSVIYAYTSNNGSPFSRRDSLIVWEDDNKVYFYQFDEFHLVYDFNLEAGDSLDYFLPTGKLYFSPYEEEENDTAVISESLYVHEVTEIESNGITLKVFDTQSTTPGYFGTQMEDIIENVGSTNNRLFGENVIYVAEGCGPTFYCYENDDISYPPNEICEYPTSTKNVYTDEEIIFYPNPVQDLLHITNSTSENINEVQVFDIRGQLLYQSSTNHKNIDMTDISSGLYLVRLKFDSGIVHIKKVYR